MTQPKPRSFQLVCVARSSTDQQVEANIKQANLIQRLADAYAQEITAATGVQVVVATLRLCGSAYRNHPHGAVRDALRAYFPNKVTARSSGKRNGYITKVIMVHDWDRLTRNEEEFREMCEEWFVPLGVTLVCCGDVDALTTRHKHLHDLYPEFVPAEPVFYFNPSVDGEKNNWSTYKDICGIIRAGHLESKNRGPTHPPYA